MTKQEFTGGIHFDRTSDYLFRNRVTLPAFALLGIVKGLLAAVWIAAEIPLVTFTYPRQGFFYPMLSLVPSGPLVAHPLPGTFVGLDPLLIATYAVGVVVTLVTVTLAFATVAWRTAPETTGWLPPVRRLLWLGTFVTVAIVASVPALVAWLPVTGRLTSTLLTALLAYFLARLFAAPVSIVRDGRDPLAAIRWSWGVSRKIPGSWGVSKGVPEIALIIFFVALTQYWLSGLPWFALLGDSTATVVGTAVGTTVFGSVFAAVMCATYDSVPLPSNQ
ncbi:hypothetical protein [Halapricum hydrolyticum]|uniref:Uncharacterized protein n=1 Tax=Halapricum hydrolyticum TaxID=2979991 RepID=A0AAE3ICC8_9EURY|nr:hypothetical protein [Halapricum hydrolyticum]MCU4716585.1 hypothetical protein [Halapricum hydrolyticum]MCU4725810.1 hypothetical protein [Halapricum hydrolyticum]